MIKKLAWAAIVVVLIVSAVYLFRHLARWEWHRALFAGVAMLAAEIALVGAVVVRAVQRATGSRAAPDERVLARIRDAAPERRHFAWLQPSDGHAGVFVSILLGGGVLVSAAAWAIDKVARATATPQMEEGLAGQLAPLQPPAGPLVAPDAPLLGAGRELSDDDVALLLGPRR